MAVVTAERRLSVLELEIAEEVGRAIARHHERMAAVATYGCFARAGDREALLYAALGLASEAGEVAGEIQKGLRVGDPYARQPALILELGDTLYYWTRLVHLVGWSPAQIVACNYRKLHEKREAWAAANKPALRPRLVLS